MTTPPSRSYLPEEVIPPVRPRGLLLTWLWVAVIVAAVNFAVVPRMLEGGRNLAGWIIGHKWRLLLRLDQPVDDLVLGDSSCNQGVNPALLARTLGDGRAVNLCTIGDMLALNDAWMLESYLRRHGPPRRVVIVHVYDIWHRDFDWTRTGSLPVGWSELRRLRPEVRLQRWQLRSYLEARYAPLYTNNLSLQARLRPGDPRLGPLPPSRRLDSLGFLADTTAFPDSVQRDLEGHRKFLAGARFRLSRDNREGLERIAHLADSAGFDVYLVSAPVFEGLAGDPAFRRYHSEVQATLDTLRQGHPRVHVLFPEPLAFPAAEMQNADHLVAGAAEKFTIAIATAVRANETTIGER